MELNNLEPRQVWKHFFEICAIPHPSHHEEALARALADGARERGFEASIDPSGNVIIRKPASPGKEGLEGIILQGHLDMVPQVSEGIAHDFLRDPIRPRRDPGDPAWIVASGTTLGADNGIGLAMALAVLEDKELSHGPLECLFTTGEEDGMVGAQGLEPGSLHGSILLNLDGEDDAELTIGCAGAIRTSGELSRPVERAEAGLVWFEASVGGLLGGHSGVDIDKGRANASLALARILGRAGEALRVASIEGGTAANAIPRTARALIGVPSQRVEALRAAVRRETVALRAELGAADPGLTASLAPLQGPVPAASLGESGSADLLALLEGLPNGLVALEPDMPDSIRTSLNLGRLMGKVENGRFILSALVMVRSSSSEEKRNVAEEVESSFRKAAESGWEAKCTRLTDSPAWTPNPASPLLAEAGAAYRQLFARAPKVISTHGGLETGVFRPRFPDWDMISMGPRILYAHSPDERVEIASVARSYSLLKELITRLSLRSRSRR